MSDQDPEAMMSLAASDPFPGVSQKRRRGVRVTSAAAMALGLAIGGSAIAGAATTTASTPNPSASGSQTNRPPFDGTPPAAVGTVKSVGTGTFTLTTQDGTTVTVNVGSSTTYLDHDVTSPSFGNVTVGAHVAVFGTDTSNTVTATKVAVGAPPTGGPGGPGGTPPAAEGTVKSVGTGTFTLTTQDGTTVTVNVGSSTTYLDHDVTSPSFGNATVGAHVAVFGTDTSNTVTATKVAVGAPLTGGPGGGRLPKPVAAG